MAIPDQSAFAEMYAGHPPWDIDKPQHDLVAVADEISGSILDAGCGTGENALFFADRGHAVTGIDFLSEPITQAKQKAKERGLAAKFQVMDALKLKDWDEQFDSVIDCGLFHVFSDEDRIQYVEGLKSVLKQEGRLFLLCFSDAEPGEQGPRRVSKSELRSTFATGWVIERLKPTQFEIRPDAADLNFSPGGPKAWFAIIRRTS